MLFLTVSSPVAIERLATNVLGMTSHAYIILTWKVNHALFETLNADLETQQVCR